MSSHTTSDNSTFPKGIHPKEAKEYSKDSKIEIMPNPKTCTVCISQNLGAPSNPVVKAKDVVDFGALIGEAGGFISSNLHSPINGKIGKTVKVTLPNARKFPAIVIKQEKEQTEGQDLWNAFFGGPWDFDKISNLEESKIVDAVSKAGIVGLGGATFPSQVKLMPNEKTPIDTYIINGCECEPYLTSDYRLMLEAPDAILAGALIGAKALGAKKIIVGIENNKPDAVSLLREKAKNLNIDIVSLQTKYPQGSEKQLIYALTGRKVPPGALPSVVNVAVNNVGTIAAIASAVLKKRPLTHRVVAVTGGGIKNPKNVFAAIGTSVREIIDFCGGLTEDAAKMISGGPMMGFAFSNLDTPIGKGTSGITILTQDEIKKKEEENCVRCGKCVEVCPMNLVPTKLALAARNKEVEVLEKYQVLSCFECGSCAFTCPSSLPIVQLIRTGKMILNAAKKK